MRNCRSDARVADSKLVHAYLGARQHVVDAGFGDEIDWQDGLSFEHVEETGFLREGAWVILSSGMRESVIRGKFAGISEAFLNWQNAGAIVRHEASCRRRALSMFCHKGKIDAIIDLAKRIYAVGFDAIRCRVADEGVSYLQSFRYIGPITALHLAKNIGLDVVKPDRHLQRISEVAGYESPAAFCQMIAEAVGDKRSVVDLVVWRYATLRRDYLDHFAGPTIGQGRINLQTSRR